MGERESVEPQLLLLILCCSTLAASVVLCFYGLKSFRVLRQKRSKNPPVLFRKPKGACALRFTSLQWLAQAIVVCNVLRQLFYFEYFVVQRALFRGFDKSSPMHAICRANEFLFHQWDLWLLCALFWFQRLLTTFNNTGMASHSVNASTVHCFYGALTVLFALNEAMCVFSMLHATDIIALKSTDLNPYQSVNPNMVLCTIAAGNRVYLISGFVPIIALFLAINCFLAFMYVRKLKSVFALANRQSSASEQMLVRKTVTVALVTTVSSILSVFCSAISKLHALWAIDAFINSLCVVLYFEFASDKYRFLCGRIEGCVMWAFTTQSTNKNVLSVSAAVDNEIQSVDLRTSSVTGAMRVASIEM